MTVTWDDYMFPTEWNKQNATKSPKPHKPPTSRYIMILFLAIMINLLQFLLVNQEVAPSIPLVQGAAGAEPSSSSSASSKMCECALGSFGQVPGERMNCDMLINGLTLHGKNEPETNQIFP